MAELVVGLSKSVVVGAITKVQSAIDEDAKVQQKMRRNLVFITLELEMMQSFLDDANQEMKNNLVRTWVKHIRQLAYEIEDFVEFVVQVDDKPVFWRRLLPLCIAPPLPLDGAVEELEQLKGRVEDVNNCYRRYNLINVDSAGSSKLAAAIQQQQPPAPGASDMLSEARDATKRQQGAFGDLTQLINKKDNNLQVISLWGAATDHGTASIIRETFTHPEICQDFTYRAWVKLMRPFNPHRFIRSLMAQFYANSCKEENAATKGMHVLTKMEATQAHLFNEFKLLTVEKRYLIILEGLSTIVDWDAIRTFLPDMKNGSCIILSTQQPEIASLCLGNFYDILELKRFSEDHSVCALFKEPRVDEVIQSSLSGMRKKEARDWMRDHPLVERQSEINELRGCVAETYFRSSNVMSVWGMAGIGKSSLVRYLYFDRMCHSNSKQFNKFTWVDVSRPFNLRSIYRSLLLDLYSEKDPVEECHKLLEQHHCLVVIDDLQSKEEWDLIEAALVSRHSASVIIVITTEVSIARYCTNDERHMFNVQCLEAGAAINLFRAEVHKKKPSSPLVSHEDVELYDLILKCGGIPRVIAGIARQLATETDTLIDTIRSLNQRFMYHLEIDPKFGTLQSLFRWMHSVILNPPDFLKPCIFYLSIFPQNCYIRQRRLLRRWIAEGYSKESVERHVEENAENFFSELVQLSIFKQVDTTASTGMSSYLVNGFIHEYIVSHPMEENLVFELGDTFAPTTQHRGRHLIIREYWKRDRVVFMSIDFSRLRSLTVFGKWESFFVSGSMSRLRVLDLENATGVEDADLEKMLKQLHCLMFLSLRGCRQILKMPSSLGDLWQLQTLDVRYTSIVTMPASMAKLQRLQYIRAGTSDALASTPHISSSWSCRHRRLVDAVVPGVLVAPEGIRKLMGLHTLGVVNVAASGGKAFLKELRKLTQLRKLGVSGINRKNSKEFLSVMEGYGHLKSLSVQLDKDNQDCFDDIALPLENLRSLKLYGLGGKLPYWRGRHMKLAKVYLEMDTLTEENGMKSLGELPELCILRVKQLQDGQLHFRVVVCGEEDDSFEKIKILQIDCGGSSSTLHVKFGSETMKKLELLKVDCCSGSPTYQFSGLENLRGLKQVLLLNGSNAQVLKEQLESQLVDHPNSVKPVVKMEEPPRSS